MDDVTKPAAQSAALQQSKTDAALKSLGLPADALPEHIAIIMDGNGRWAQQQGQPRHVGHQRGAETVRDIVTQCAHLNLKALTLYSFSMENWKRPKTEIDFLMALYVEYLKLERPTMLENNVRFVQVGRREGLSQEVLDEIDLTADLTAKHTGLTLALAINYGSRAEITDAAKALALKVKNGELDPEAITEELLADHLYTKGLPDPDLLIRTAGEMRVSNYLLWQISYAEFYVTDVCWPDFDLAQFRNALHAFAQRQRKFGAVPTPE